MVLSFTRHEVESGPHATLAASYPSPYNLTHNQPRPNQVFKPLTVDDVLAAPGLQAASDPAAMLTAPRHGAAPTGPVPVAPAPAPLAPASIAPAPNAPAPVLIAPAPIAPAPIAPAPIATEPVPIDPAPAPTNCAAAIDPAPSPSSRPAPAAKPLPPKPAVAVGGDRTAAWLIADSLATASWASLSC